MRNEHFDEYPVKNKKKYSRFKCIKCGDKPALNNNGGLCEDCQITTGDYTLGYACHG